MFHILNDPNERSADSFEWRIRVSGCCETIVYGAQFHWDDIAYQVYANFNLINIFLISRSWAF